MFLFVHYEYGLLFCVSNSLLAGSADNVNLTADVAVTCLKNAISYFHDHTDSLKKAAAMIFPCLLVIPQVVPYFEYIYIYIFLSG